MSARFPDPPADLERFNYSTMFANPYPYTTAVAGPLEVPGDIYPRGRLEVSAPAAAPAFYFDAEAAFRSQNEGGR